MHLLQSVEKSESLSRTIPDKEQLSKNHSEKKTVSATIYAWALEHSISYIKFVFNTLWEKGPTYFQFTF